ncbi:HIT family protein [Sphingomonas sinipercae]|uniref:HIT family protein n=1 Tax=Sphingomonas sinipercae TaxID=2714944 RepID=A0A6G7ZNQ7_9SPHN|nr:HIT family protein [Sphingomonas sinipercae]QIL02558.1 HIT family protein [Sphingomonas sinipercae]
MANATMGKFGFPGTLVRDFGHWAVLVRPAQVTLGSLILASTGEATRYSDLPAAAFGQQGEAIRAIEAALTAFCKYERLNYLMLMMVDPHVHFHVIPRYEGAREWNGLKFADAGWPGPPDLGSARTLAAPQLTALTEELRPLFDEGRGGRDRD